MDDLHGKIMNIRCVVPDGTPSHLALAYKLGHKAARHEAARLAAAALSQPAAARDLCIRVGHEVSSWIDSNDPLPDIAAIVDAMLATKSAAQGDSSHPAGGECGGVQGLTPGPYSVRKSLAGTGFWHITSPAKQDIGAVRSLADAHMFAASLDLFDALKGVLRVADRATAEFDAARAAIAKATQ